MMSVQLVAVVAVLLSLQVPHCHPSQCERLGFENVAADISNSGSFLRTCSNDIANNTLKNGLPFQLNETIMNFSTAIDQEIIGNYFNRKFKDEWRKFLPNPAGFDDAGLREVLSDEVDTLVDNLLIDDDSSNFNTAEFVHTLTVAIAVATGHRLSSDDSISTCISQEIQSSGVNVSSIRRVARHLERLRKGVTSLKFYECFLRNYSQNTIFEFPSNCVDRLNDISSCGQCNRMLCSNTCGALIRGCYSPYYDALPKHFNNLWNVTIQVLNVLNRTLQDLFNENPRLLQENVMELVRNCGVTTTIPAPMMPNTAQLIPGEQIQNIESLRGRGLSYGENLPIVCQMNSADGLRCSMGTCSANSFCTSSSQCFDETGTERITGTPEYNRNKTEDQAGNPVIPLTKEVLCNTVKKIGNPVNDFLMGVSAMLSEDIEIPPPPADDCDDGPGSSESGIIKPPLFFVVVAAGVLVLYFL